MPINPKLIRISGLTRCDEIQQPTMEGDTRAATASSIHDSAGNRPLGETQAELGTSPGFVLSLPLEWSWSDDRWRFRPREESPGSTGQDGR